MKTNETLTFDLNIDEASLSFDLNIDISKEATGFLKKAIDEKMPLKIIITKKTDSVSIKNSTMYTSTSTDFQQSEAHPENEKSDNENTVDSSITVEDIKKVLLQKIKTNRQEIKQKLTDLGAPKVSLLDPSNYKELYEFLLNLPDDNI